MFSSSFPRVFCQLSHLSIQIGALMNDIITAALLYLAGLCFVYILGIGVIVFCWFFFHPHWNYGSATFWTLTPITLGGLFAVGTASAIMSVGAVLYSMHNWMTRSSFATRFPPRPPSLLQQLGCS